MLNDGASPILNLRRTDIRREIVMDIGLILKIGGIGILVACMNQMLSKAGKDDLSAFVSLAGVIVILVMLMGEIGTLISTVRGVFGI